MLTQKELIHYSRQIILSEIDEAGQNKLKNAHVLIVGIGGLGSPVAMYLAASGVGHLTLIDHDNVELSNLQRQIVHSLDSVNELKVDSAKQRIEELSPFIEIAAIAKKATSESLDSIGQPIDVIVDCTDNYKTRFMLNEFSLSNKIPLVQGSAIKFQGHLSTFNQTPSSPCYHCLFSEDEHNDESCEDQGVFPPIVGLVGSLQASETLKIILGLKTLDGFYQTYDLLNNRNKTFAIGKNSLCKTCNTN